jgi:hypothetical protein
MATYAVMSDNIVQNIIVAGSIEIAKELTGLNCIEYTEENPAGIGWAYDGTTFIAPILE